MLKDLFKRNVETSLHPQRPAEVRGDVGSVTLEDAQAWNALFTSWLKDDAGVGVSVERALTCPPVWCAVMFLSRTMANIPLHVYKKVKDNPKRQNNLLSTILNGSPNGEMTSFDFRQFLFQGMWTDGAGRAWIERDYAGTVVALWPLEFARTTVKRKGFKKVYEYRDSDRVKIYAAADVIDLTYALGPDLLRVMSPINKCRGAIGLYLNLQNYANSFFKSGGVPPLTLEGPMASGAEAIKRSSNDVEMAIKNANENGQNVLPIPTGFKLNAIAFDPSKGQMTDAKKSQIIEIAQAFQIGPAFLQDLSNGKFNNVEQQDLNLVKHLISHFAKKLEQEVNLKIFGLKRGALYSSHNLDALLRGDFKTRIEALARGVNSALITPNEARSYERRQRVDNPAADDLHIQGATVPLGTNDGTKAPTPEPKSKDDNNAE